MGVKKILIVDFDQEFLRFLSRCLRNEGFSVVTATDGFAGLEMHKSEAPDLVITEAMLPKLHGFELCSRISHSAVRKVPVVIVTGVYRDTVYKTEAMHTFGASAYFEKPLDPDEIVLSLKKILGLPLPKETQGDPVDAAIMESLVAEAAVPPSPKKPAGPAHVGDEIDDMLRNTLAEFGLKPGKKQGLRRPAPPPAPEPSPEPDPEPLSAVKPRTQAPAPAAPPSWAPHAVAAPVSVVKPAPVAFAPSFGGYSEPRKRNVPPRVFGAIAGVLVLTSATIFVLKPGKTQPSAETITPPAVEGTLPDPNKGSAAADPAEMLAALLNAAQKKSPEPAPARTKPKPAPSEASNRPLPALEEIKPMEPESTLKLEAPASDAAPSPTGDAPAAVDDGAEAVAAESPIEIPSVKIKAGDVVPLDDTDTPPRQVRSADPVYPAAARSLGREGSIVINLLISETGDVIQTAVIGGAKGSLGFDKAAENAVRKWKYTPAMKDGVPVRVWKPVTIAFKLKK